MKKRLLSKSDWLKIARVSLLISFVALIIPIITLLITDNLETLQKEWFRYVGLLALTFLLAFFTFSVLVYVDRRMAKKEEDKTSQSKETKETKKSE